MKPCARHLAAAAACLGVLAAAGPGGTGCAARRGVVPEEPLLQEIDGELRGLVSADVDGDGAAELVALGLHRLLRVETTASGWTLSTLVRLPPGLDGFGLSAGDVDGDGAAELVVWGLQPGLTGLIYGWNGAEVVREAAPVPVMLRVLRRDGQPLLLGQRATWAGSTPAIHRYALEAGRLVRGVEVPGTEGWRLADLFYGPHPGGGEDAVYTWSPDGELERHEGGSVVWRGDEFHMARPLATEVERANLLGERTAEVVAFPVPPAVADVDGDGVAEVLVATSDAAPVQMLSRVRPFRGGSYHLLEVSDRGLRPTCTSLLLGRMLTGVAAHDADGDGALDAVVTVVLQRRSGFGRGRSAVAVLDPITGDLVSGSASPRRAPPALPAEAAP